MNHQVAPDSDDRLDENATRSDAVPVTGTISTPYRVGIRTLKQFTTGARGIRDARRVCRVGLGAFRSTRLETRCWIHLRASTKEYYES